MLITREQIERFFAGQCTQDEAEIIAKYLENNPQVLRRYIMDDWKDAAAHEPLPEGLSEQMLTTIRREALPGSQPRQPQQLPVRRWLPWTAAAALILLLAGIFLLRPGQEQRPALASVRSREMKDSVPDQALPVSQVKFNNTRIAQTILLSDSSVVTLEPNSTLRYPTPFADDKREITLEGAASFKVAKDQGRPFTVSAGHVLTTVLGTVFNVAENEQGVIVKLFSGKVRSQPKDSALQGWHGNIVLLPGEQLKYIAAEGLVEVSGFGKIGTPATAAADHNGSRNGSLNKTLSESLVFTNKRLPDVLDKLAARYHTVISYDKKQISGLYFSGTVLQSDSLLPVLEMITNMNELMIIQDADGFIIQKKIP